MKYKILIIDDESQRNNSYNDWLSKDFEIEIQNDIVSKDLHNAINDPKIDCIFLDMVLSKSPGLDKESFESIVDMIGKKKPIILISRYFNRIASWIKAQAEKTNIIFIIGWDEIYNDSSVRDENIAKNFITRIKLELNRYYHRSNSEKAPDSSIFLLHISDLQFGDPDYTPDAKILNERIIAQYLVQEFKKTIDFIVVSGDVAYSGLPSEFDVGYNWLSSIAKLLFPESFNNPKERILLVPGNHDVNLSLNAADYFNYDFKKQKAATADLMYLSRRTDPIEDHKRFGLLPFTQFAYKLTGDLNWIDNPFGDCFINDQFLGWGIRFIHVNTVMELGYLDPDKISIVGERIKDLVNKTAPVSEKIFSIIIAHNGPEDFGYALSSSPSQSASDLFALINGLGGRLYLHGHRHKPEKLRKVDYEGNFTSSILYSEAGTISLNKNLQANDSRRSFSVIELRRKGDVVVGIISNIFEIEGQKINEVPHKKSEANYD